MDTIFDTAQTRVGIEPKRVHISVCVCTYKRPQLLKRSLESICAQRTDGLFTYSVVVVDNDSTETARAAVTEMRSGAPVEIQYCVEPRQNIAHARNKAVENASGDLVAFIDDDEFPIEEWLLTLFRTISVQDVDGVLGPVNPRFEEGTPKWVIDGGFYDRPGHPTGMVLQWRKCRTGNVLLRREVFAAPGAPFNPECLSGEDQDFFRRKIDEGHQFIWCQEAPVFEVVPPARWNRGFLVRRALFRGIFAQRNHGLQAVRVLQALISVPVYIVVLPFALLFGQAKFMSCVFKLSYHAGRLLALCGLNPIKQAYVIE
jgi:succinoglycan biosynthesis protein ExoM